MSANDHRPDAGDIAQAQRLIDRLERLSADSYWAHQACGVRGALLRSIEQLPAESGPPEPSRSASAEVRLDALVRWGYAILEKAVQDSNRRV